MIYTPFTKVLDWFSALLNLVIYPFVFLLSIFILKFYLSDVSWTYLMFGLTFIIFILFFSYYRTNYRHLTECAEETAMVHFKPSYKDLIIGLYSNSIMVFILVILLILFFPNMITSSGNDLPIISGIFLVSFGLQILTTIIINHSKIKLIDTAIEPLNTELIEKMKNKTPDISKIKKFVFADIKPASLFLSAGVTNYSFKSNVCLVSRYFQWKLTENELMAVLGHEIGHVVHRDMLQSRILLSFQAIIRTILFYFLLITIQTWFSKSTINIILLFVQLLIFLLAFITQMFLSFCLQLRMINQEIMADEYGASLMGNYNLAYTLKKLPKVIPAPVDDHPLNFLGFRVAILFFRAKQRNEVDNSIKEFSRFSDN